MRSFHFLYPCLNSFSGIVSLLFIVPLTFFRFKFCNYNLILSDISKLSKFATPFNISWVNGVKLSFPINVRNGSTVNGVPCAWCRCCALSTASSWSISSWLWIVLNCKSIWFFIPFRCTVVSMGISRKSLYYCLSLN